MSALQGLILGLVQGLTEFLPVSSSGHLIIARELLGLNSEFGLSVDATLHLATAAAVVVYFRHDLLKLFWSVIDFVRGRFVEPSQKTLFWALIAGTIPGVLIGLPLEHTADTVFRSAHLVAYSLIAGSILFVFAEWFAKQDKRLSIKKGLYLGFFQALALIPGISRSGAVISGGLILGLTREEAARFGFLLSLPIILGAGSKKFLELGSAGAVSDFGFPLLVAALAAFISGLAAIHFLISFLKKHTLYTFAVYRVLLAITVLTLLY